MMNQKPKNRTCLYILAIFAVLFVGGILLAHRAIKNITPESIINSPFVQEQIQKQLGDTDIDQDIFSHIPTLLGFSKPKNYLILFLNNTELRPGGGFIGSYALVNVDGGKPNILKVEGTEILDRQTPSSWKPVPPAPLTKYLGVDRWYFRDSNWSPDFSESSKKGLEFYKAEGGQFADNIDMVIGITPVVLQELISLTGPITVDGITFKKEDLVETLEYEVEFGYRERGISKDHRKDIIKKFMDKLIEELGDSLITNFNSYLPTITSLLNQKQIILYSRDESQQKLFEKQNWTGNISSTDSDYLHWSDANLAALKTDHAMERQLQYRINKQENGDYIATANMHYTHNGQFDWRTTRYLTYARVYVPEGAVLTSAMSKNSKGIQTYSVDEIDQGQELGKQWFGQYFSLEPGQEGDVSFFYTLPKKVVKSIEQNNYTLITQKQIGTANHGLTINLLFGKNIIGADPAEEKIYWGDNAYTLNTDLTIDRKFQLELTNN